MSALLAAAALAGTASVVAPGLTAPLPSGFSVTAFTLRLPSTAACSGDSAEGGFRVQSYMAPASVNPATLEFGSTGPRPQATGAAFRQPLYTLTSSGYVDAQTANADQPGDPGAIVNVPAFNLAVFRPGDIPPGAYNVGLACTKGPASATQVEKYWNATIVVAASAADAPAGVTWTTPQSSNGATATTSPALLVSPERQDLPVVTQEADSAPTIGQAVLSSGAPPSFALAAFALSPRFVLVFVLFALALWARLVLFSHRPTED